MADCRLRRGPAARASEEGRVVGWSARSEGRRAGALLQVSASQHRNPLFSDQGFSSETPLECPRIDRTPIWHRLPIHAPSRASRAILGGENRPGKHAPSTRQPCMFKLPAHAPAPTPASFPTDPPDAQEPRITPGLLFNLQPGLLEEPGNDVPEPQPVGPLRRYRPILIEQRSRHACANL